MDPTDPIDRMDPVELTDRIEPVELTDQRDPRRGGVAGGRSTVAILPAMGLGVTRRRQ